MKVNNKFNLGETVTFGSYIAKVTGISIFPKGHAYKLSFLDSDNKYVTVEVYDFEINKYDKNKFGFGV